MWKREITLVISFPFTIIKKKENNMIKSKNIERLEVTTRWVSVAASVVLLGLQVTRLIKSPKEDSSIDESEE